MISNHNFVYRDFSKFRFKNYVKNILQFLIFTCKFHQKILKIFGIFTHFIENSQYDFKSEISVKNYLISIHVILKLCNINEFERLASFQISQTT